ncbi:FAD-dependent oxidoreductase [Chelatococcus sp. SYSU_G07232]|uniref:FAD-dependent oxidoreductase n=1 Tax=Chelatococcus albus TaxID=3047466 RepID=A0ABT7AMS0_9HYPH|nr:FAD-dependent oxidoreductase [Chelatococcus sp. SYSU_G07232]MDJ1159851.1 FAD-dependent oxidoreductase [Chelatococcus sp. SYSU_G07232]
MSSGDRKSLYQFGYRRSPDQDARPPVHHPVVVVGAGPVGLSLAVDLALKNVPVVVLDDADRIGEGSRAICFAKRTLEIWDRLGVGERMVEKGVVWQVGKVFHGEELAYQFDLLPEGGHKMPAFINLQQYYAEAYLVERAAELPGVDLRWRNKVVGVERRNDLVLVTIDTPEGPYRLAADWLVACDGSRSSVRSMLGLDFAGEVFEDQFLIADVKMTAEFPTERWFWFDPPFHSGQSALLHKQPDDVWRIDLQLGPHADAEVERRPENVVPRIARMLGHDAFTLEWVSIYKFQCRRIDRFVHGRVVFAGDSAHQVSPFGARGANSGVQDADNLAWKLALVVKGEAPASLLDSYDLERGQAADENIAHSTRSTDFIAPHSPAERILRDAVLSLARHADFARRMVNSGRLSLPTAYDTPLSTPDEETWEGGVAPGAPLVDAPLTDEAGRAVWLTEAVRGGFTLVAARNGVLPEVPEGVARVVVATAGREAGGGGFADGQGHFAARYAMEPGNACLVRPDGHVAARFRHPTPERVKAALDRACGRA